MQELDWIKDLKVGDEVIVISGGWGAREHIEKVENVNKTTVRVCGLLFKFDGYERTSSWNRAKIKQCTKEARERVGLNEERRKLANALYRADFMNMPVDKLRRINAIIQEP